MMVIDGVKPLGPVWPGRAVDKPDRRNQRHDETHDGQQNPEEKRDDDQASEIDEYA